jgi:hypothetical protein
VGRGSQTSELETVSFRKVQTSILVWMFRAARWSHLAWRCPFPAGKSGPALRVHDCASARSRHRRFRDEGHWPAGVRTGGCSGRHAGPFLSNHLNIFTDEGGTIRPARWLWTRPSSIPAPVIYSFDSPVLLASHPKTLAVPISDFHQTQVDLAWAHHGSGGGYKVPSLVGLYWTAPYLHDGGVAVGKDENANLGVAGTVGMNQMPDPFNSLKALIDRNLRARVVAANESSPELHRMNVQGVGHNYWVDPESGFTGEQQRALIQFLLTYESGS